uniref:Uncharacterized protein n=1 Tax=Abalone asfa-like virus TaxID=2839893 RepID=A0A5K7Y3D3_9VIRU|nr:hypothetical protein [Abalone asfa-like virus]BCY04522.1 hypothetical protein [Abalone asfa-like virus]
MTPHHMSLYYLQSPCSTLLPDITVKVNCSTDRQYNKSQRLFYVEEVRAIKSTYLKDNLYNVEIKYSSRLIITAVVESSTGVRIPEGGLPLSVHFLEHHILLDDRPYFSNTLIEFKTELEQLSDLLDEIDLNSAGKMEVNLIDLLS